VSKDPFEELFGPAEEEPQPVPARERLAYEQAERVRTSPLPAAERSATPPNRDGAAGGRDTAESDRANKVKPWIIVGIITVVALIASIVILNLARAGDSPAETATPTPTPTQTSAPAPTTTSPTPTEEADDEEDAPDTAPSVEVGPTNTMPIGPWNATSELSQRFGQTSFAIPDGVNLVLTNDLLNSFPDSCAAMRQAWGATKLADGTYEVLKPETRCEAAPELYDEVWGLLDAWVKTIT